MTIGIDFDNTLVNTYEVAQKYLKIYKPENNYNYYHELPLKEEIEFIEKYYHEITRNLVLFEGVKEAFDYFKHNNIKTVLITARGYDGTDLIDITKEYLKNHDIAFDNMIFSAFYKGGIAKEIGVDLMIDDKAEVLEDMQNHGIKTLKFKGMSEKFKVVNSWQEIIDYLKKGDI